MAKKTITKPPSRAKYEAKNPVVSTRVSAEFKERLHAYLRQSGKSFAEWLREQFEGSEQQEKAKETIEAYLRGYQQGLKDGAALAAEYGATFLSEDGREMFQEILGGYLEAAEKEEASEEDVREILYFSVMPHLDEIAEKKRKELLRAGERKEDS